ncbi:hypothetical protein E1I18_01210 [Mycoplasmopsis mucosicanis]|uniref:Uncharacterized protein n=1 Tax=Mycoplasmopsis mucosicanis TaxID=458208 RepID=A0A507SS34_9BACT|nr:hypothetical protein [Mycoplasmopsis mucosicanis]TQC54061.1 hypothetical protein E1I18_01210 [Mycoplasmopsis mucosicanis]
MEAHFFNVPEFKGPTIENIKFKSVKEICTIELGLAKRRRLEEYNKIFKETHKQPKLKPIYEYASENLKRVLTCMSELSKIILLKEILEPDHSTCWWENLCSKTTFYKRRNSMIKEFAFFYFD